MCRVCLEWILRSSRWETGPAKSPVRSGGAPGGDPRQGMRSKINVARSIALPYLTLVERRRFIERPSTLPPRIAKDPLTPRVPGSPLRSATLISSRSSRYSHNRAEIRRSRTERATTASERTESDKTSRMAAWDIFKRTRLVLLAHHAGPRIVIRTRARTHVIPPIPSRRNNAAMCSTSGIRSAAFDTISLLEVRFSLSRCRSFKYATRRRRRCRFLEIPYRFLAGDCSGSISIDSRNDCVGRGAARDCSADRVGVHCCHLNAPLPANNSPSVCRRAQ